MFTYLIWEFISAVVGGLVLLFLVIYFFKQKPIWSVLKQKAVWIPIAIFVVAFFSGLISNKTYPPHFAMPPFMMSHAPGGLSAELPFLKVLEFFRTKDKFEFVDNIGADPNAVPAPIERSEPELVKIELTTQEVIGEVAPGIFFNYWTYNKQVPGPMLRVREGDTIELTLTNHPSSLHPHNLDLHAVTGPGGGAAINLVEPGETKTFRWKALAPGLYVYHCATPNVSTHNAHGQYGLILVEPEEGLPQVDKEFYVMQGELYTVGQLGKKGLVPFDSQALLDSNPNYVTFNGIVESAPRMKVKTGDKVRIYVGNGGLNLISSFHPIGEIFDTVYPEAAIGEGSAIFKNVQTTAVLPGGAAIVEFVAEVPGNLLLVDHALARMNKGAWAVVEVEGEPRPDIFQLVDPKSADQSHDSME